MAKVNTKTNTLLKGEHVVAAKLNGVAGIVVQVREQGRDYDETEIKAPFVIDFDADILPGIFSWPCNTTNARILGRKISEESGDWVGHAIMLGLTKVNNPRTNKIVDSLEPVRVLDPKAAAKSRKKPAKYTAEDINRMIGRGKGGIKQPISNTNWDDVPF